MCGIAGIVRVSGERVIERAELERMAGVLGHRGPDEAGVWRDEVSGRCGLAHRRLAIIDREGGQQPLSNEDGSIWICYNGECYNYRQLRSELEAAGHKFRTNSDTEVIVHLYEEYGYNCVEHIRGMFAFAVWDQNRRVLFLARDRMGQKPLYYAYHQGRFIFASECKAILQAEDFPRRPNDVAIGQYLLLGYITAGQSAFADIHQLPPAHTLVVDAERFTEPVPGRYWSIPQEPTFSGSMEEAAEMLRAQLTEAVSMRLISEVPLGAFLSGGMDSTIIVGLMSKISNNSVRTASIGFEEGLYNELDYARQAAERFSCDHAEYTVKADCQGTVEKLSYYYDEPFADSSALPTYHLSHAARKRVTVALTGDGGDECFGGYDRYRAIQLTERIKRSRFLSWLARRRFWEKLPAGEHHSRLHRLKRLVSAAGLPVHQRYLEWVSVFEPWKLAEILSAEKCAELLPYDRYGDYLEGYFLPGGTVDSTKLARGVEPHPTDEYYMGQAMLVDGEQYLPGDLNTKIDRASMSIGLELRCPFQDHKVVELAYSLPAAWRHDGKMGKLILRQACGDLLPKRIARRGKMGFGVPVGRWFREELREMFVDTVLSSRALQRGYFQRAALEKLLSENDQNRADHGHRLWALLMLELWHQRYIDGKSVYP